LQPSSAQEFEIASGGVAKAKTFPTPIDDDISIHSISGFLQHHIKDLMRST
jgi:hypothetical protein